MENIEDWYTKPIETKESKPIQFLGGKVHESFFNGKHSFAECEYIPTLSISVDELKGIIDVLNNRSFIEKAKSNKGLNQIQF